MWAQALVRAHPLPSFLYTHWYRERFLGLLKTNRREGIHVQIVGSLHRDHTTASQRSNLFVIKKFALRCPHPDNNISILPWPCYDHGRVFFLVLPSPSVLSCCSCNIIFVYACVYLWKISLLCWWHLEKATLDPLNDSQKRDFIMFIF